MASIFVSLNGVCLIFAVAGTVIEMSCVPKNVVEFYFKKFGMTPAFVILD